MRTRENESFLVLNGIQTQSARVHLLLAEMQDMRSMGVDILRVSPQAAHTLEIVQAFDAVRQGQCSAVQAQQQIAAYLPGEACNGYWYGRPGLEQSATHNLAECA